MTVDACLAGYGTAAAMIAPYILSRMPGIERMPRLGLAAWLVAAVSVLGSWFAAAASLANHAGQIARTVGIVLLVALAVRLAWASAWTWWSTRRQRTRHADAAVLLGRHDLELGALVVQSAQPAIYCLPRTGGGLIVVTTGARTALSPRQLQAVMSHERAHLAGHHHMLLAVGQVLCKALPGLRLCRQLRTETARLLEMRADDAAARIHGRLTVATAIAAMRRHTAPAPALGAGGSSAAARARRLTDFTPATLRSRVALGATALVLATGPYLATIPPCPHPW